MRRPSGPGRGGRTPAAGRAARIPSLDKNSNKKKKSRRERRAARTARSGAAFAVAAGAVVAAVAALAFRAFSVARKGKRLLADAASRPLHFTEHARCRMDCRHISAAQVRATLACGRVNPLKSDLAAEPCAKLVVDAVVPGEGQNMRRRGDTGEVVSSAGGGKKHVQAVLSACPRDTTVVTVIDTDRDWACYCPGD